MTWTTRLQTVHELKQLVDDGFEEAPMSSQEARILPDDVHNVWRNDRLVVFATFLFTESQQLLTPHSTLSHRDDMADIQIQHARSLTLQWSQSVHTKSSANAEEPREHTVSWNCVKRCTNVRRTAFENACNRQMTFKVIQGHCRCWHLIGHIWFPISLPL